MDISGEAEVGGGVGGIILLTIEKGINKYIKKILNKLGRMIILCHPMRDKINSIL